MAEPLLEHMNKWESALHMHGYYVVGMTANLYPTHGCIITIFYKEEKTYLVSVADYP